MNRVKIKLQSIQQQPISIKSDGIKITRNDFNTIKNLKIKLTDIKMRCIRKNGIGSLSTGSFVNLKDHLILNICELMGNDMEIFFNLNKVFKTLFLNILKRISKKICENLIIYKEIFSFEQASVTIQKNKENNQRFRMKFNLKIKAKISKSIKSYDKCYFFGHIYKFTDGKNDLYQTFYKFEIKSPMVNSLVWIMKEESNYLDDLHNKAFFQPILPFTNNDYILFTLNLNRSDSFLEFSKFKWIPHRCESSQKLEKFIFDSNYNFNKNKEINFDLARICEIEFTKKNWKDITDFRENTFNQYLNKFDFNTNERLLELLENYKKILKPYFTMVQANADIDCYILLKLIFRAITLGKIKSEELGITITVKDQSQSITNEVKKNGLLYDSSNEIELRKGDYVVFYFSKRRKRNYEITD